MSAAVWQEAPAMPNSGRFLEITDDVFRAGFNRRPFLIKHLIAGHPLFELPRLVELSRRLPPNSVEYNIGDLPLTIADGRAPHTGLSVDETIRRIEGCASWLVLKWVEQEPEYRDLLHRCIDAVTAHPAAIASPIVKREGFIFVSSPNAVTPYHMDGEHNFLLQIRGTKTVCMFDGNDRSILSDREIENFYAGGHRNLVLRPENADKGKLFELSPGDGLHFPVTAPHWVKNGGQVSISFSITFQTLESERRGIIYRANSMLRNRGLRPKPFGSSSICDSVKFYGFRTLRRARRVWETLRDTNE